MNIGLKYWILSSVLVLCFPLSCFSFCLGSFGGNYAISFILRALCLSIGFGVLFRLNSI